MDRNEFLQLVEKDNTHGVDSISVLEQEKGDKDMEKKSLLMVTPEVQKTLMYKMYVDCVKLAKHLKKSDEGGRRRERLPLVFAGGVEVMTLEELREHFDIESVCAYWENGELETWLRARYHDDIALEVEGVNPVEEDIKARLYEIFDIESPDMVAPSRMLEEERELKRF